MISLQNRLEYARYVCTPVFVHGGYQSACVKSQQGPGRTTYVPYGIGLDPGSPSPRGAAAADGAVTSVTVPGFATGSLVTDLNGDGIAGDAVLVMSAAHSITVILLKDDNLESPSEYSTGTGTNPVSVAAGDVNGDHFTDLVTANSGTFVAGNFVPGSLSLLLGKGDGTFGAASTLSAGIGPGDVGLGDFNHDGKLDLAVANGANLDGADITTKSVIVRLGAGDGSFGPEIPVATAQRTLALKVLDFNGDGRPDILTTGSLLIGKGDGTFDAPVNLTPGLSPILVQVEDLNQDGKPDIIFGTVTPEVATILIGRGDGTVAAAQNYVLNESPSAVAFEDVIGEEAPDLIFTNAGNPTILPGRGDGTFEGVQAVPASANPVQGQNATAAAVADFTGDGIPDAAIANGGSISNGMFTGVPAVIMPGIGGGKFGMPITIPAQPGYGVVTGDWNADSKPDLAFVATGTNSPILMVATGLGGGAFTTFSSTALPGEKGSVRSTLITALVNADAAPDLLVANMGHGDVSVFLGAGNGNFTAASPVVIGPDHGAAISDFGTTPGGIAVGDFNGDHYLDMIVTYEGDFGMLNGGLKIALGKGDGTFQSPVSLRSAINAEGVAAGDFNRDGHLDVAVAMEVTSNHWDVAILPGRGDGTFASPMPVGLTENRLISGVIVMDADRDGKLDLGVPFGGDKVLGLRGLGDGNFVPVMERPVGGTEVVAADLNQDGWPDLLAPNGFLAIYLNELKSLNLPGLSIESIAGKVVLKWPVFYPDLFLTESPDLSTPFSASVRAINTVDGFREVKVNPLEAAAGFFRLETD